MFDLVANSKSGAVKVDWVVLTAANVGLGRAIPFSSGSGVTETADTVSTNLASRGVATTH